jgi:hypothetical protein
MDLGYDEFINSIKKGKVGELFLTNFIKNLDSLKRVRQKYFEPSLHLREKDKLKKEFTTIKDDLFKMSLELIKQRLLDAEFANKVTGWDPFDDSNPAPFFNKSWMFGVENGFDVVIANPPYIRHESIKPIKPQLSKRFGKFYCGTADIYTYFYKAGIDSLKPYGHLCFIAPNKFMRAGYGKNTRALLTTEAMPKVVIDFCDLPIFDATTYPSVLLVEKRKPSKEDKTLAVTFTTEEQLAHIDETIGAVGFKMPISALRTEGWNLEKPGIMALMEKLRKAGKPLSEYVNGKFYYGIKTGLNEAFVIDEATRKRLVSEDSKSEELIKPWLRGRDIKKWKAEWAELYLINIPSSSNHHWPWSDEKAESKAKKIFKETYPAIHDHLTKWKDKLEKRDDQGKFWWELRSCAYYGAFEGAKITWGNLATEPKFAFDSESRYVSAPAVIIPTDDLCLLSVLNSPLCKWWISLQAAVRSGGFLEYKPMYVGTVPVFPAADEQKAPIVERVKAILANPDVLHLEAEIDKLVYDLYELTPAEIEIVEGKA